MRNPVFIPKDQIIPGVEYRGYVAYAEGLVRKDRAPFTGMGHDGTLRLKPVHEPVPAQAVEPLRRRTPDQRVNSMAGRIMAQLNASGGLLTESVFREVQAVAWEVGKPVSYEQARELASMYLHRAEKLQEEQDRKKIVRQSPYVLAGGQHPDAPVSREG